MNQADNSIKAGIIVKTRFIDKALKKSNEQTFASYIDYIDRAEAVRTEHFDQFSGYNDYMGNPEKSGKLFTSGFDSLNNEQLNTLKALFQKAYDNDSIMWQSVISFDNRYLTKMGLYDSTTKTLNEAKLRECTRAMMKAMLENENMSSSAIWSASIHYNTDNIHIHVATVEPNPTRKKRIVYGQERPVGYIRAKTRRAMKSKVVNIILANDRSIMDELVRNKMVRGKNSVWSFEHPELAERFLKLYRKLPKDRRTWYYNKNAMSPFHKEIDEMTRAFVRIYYKQEFAEFQQILIREQVTLKEAYGENSKSDDYAKNKMRDFYERMGNAVLKEMREYAKICETDATKLCTDFHTTKEYARGHALHSCLYRIREAMQAEWKQKSINQQAYYRLEHGIEP